MKQKKRRQFRLFFVFLTELALLLIFSSWPPTLPSLPPSIKAAPLRFYLTAPHKIDACAIPNACIRADKSRHEILVPSTHLPHLALLRRCIRPNVRLRFYHPEAPPAPLRQPVDVIGLQVEDAYFAHFPHFAREFLANLAVPAALFLQRNLSAPYCFSNASSPLSPCHHRAPLRPQFALSERVLGATDSWNRGLAALATRSGHSHQLRHVHLLRPELFSSGPRCFRSVLTSALPYNAASARRDGLLRAAGVERRLHAPATTCAPHIIVITRDARSSTDRTIPPPLLRQLRVELSLRLIRAGLADATVEFVSGLGKLPFDKQVALAQRADVLIAVHGAELTNGLFLKRGASVVEIFPFGYHLPWFDRLFIAMGVRHVPIIAPPDTERFSSCLRTRAAIRFPHMTIPWGWRVHRAFMHNVSKYNMARNDDERLGASDFYSNYFIGRYCARSQQINIDPVALAATIVREAERVCSKPS